jgi:hypothetical protein
MNKLFLQMSSYSTANKAHEELQQFVKKWHYALVDDQVLENAVDEIKREIVRINEKYTRCKDITMSVFRDKHGFEGERKGITNISVDGNFYISVHEVKSEVLSAVKPICLCCGKEIKGSGICNECNKQ